VGVLFVADFADVLALLLYMLQILALLALMLKLDVAFEVKGARKLLMANVAKEFLQ